MWIAAGQLRTRGAELRGATGVAAVHHDVGARDQVGEPVVIAWVGGVEHAAALVGVVQRERNAGAGHAGQLRAARVPAGRFHLQDVGAEVGEQPGHRVGIAVTQVQHPQHPPAARPSG